MEVTNINKRELYEKIRELKKLILSVGIKYPLDIFDICSKFENVDISLCDFKTNGLRGMAVVADNESDLNCILVNSNLSYEEQNFHGVHELIHIYTSEPNCGNTFNCYDKLKPFQSSYIEWIANEGAAELMIPYDEILLYIKDIIDLQNSSVTSIYEITEAISKKYNVTSTVAHNRLNNLKFEIWQYLNGIPLDKIEILSKNSQKKLGIDMDLIFNIENKHLSHLLDNYNVSLKSTSFFDFSNSYENNKSIRVL